MNRIACRSSKLNNERMPINLNSKTLLNLPMISNQVGNPYRYQCILFIPADYIREIYINCLKEGRWKFVKRMIYFIASIIDFVKRMSVNLKFKRTYRIGGRSREIPKPKLQVKGHGNIFLCFFHNYISVEFEDIIETQTRASILFNVLIDAI